MTETSTPSNATSPSAGDGASGGLDPRLALLAAMDGATPILVQAVAADAELATPCSAFTLHDLLAHVMGVGNRAVAMGHGRPAASVPPTLEPADGDWMALWNAAVAEAREIWPTLDPATPIEVPWATLPTTDVAGMYTGEVLVHTWDVAASLGAAVAPDPALIAVAEQAMRRQLPATDRAAMYAELRKAMPPGLTWTDPFGEAVAVGADEAPIERMVALAGRDSAWAPAR